MLTPETLPVLPAGHRLANGATVIAASATAEPINGFVAHGVVLAVTTSGQYATWVYRLSTDSTHSGEYFGSLDDALTGFRRRCQGMKLAVLVG